MRASYSGVSPPPLLAVRTVNPMLARFALFLSVAAVAFGQVESGELRIRVVDQSGLAAPAHATVSSEASHYQREFDTDSSGHLTVQRLPFGVYAIRITGAGFQPASSLLEIHSSLPKELTVTLGVGATSTTVEVSGAQTLIDPSDMRSVNRIGGANLEDRAASLPGRSLAELVDEEPGWVFEANGVLHPRGEEYQAQYVIDGLPLTDNRSAAFTPDLDAEGIQEMSVYTAGFPAEYGRKLGGVIEVETRRDKRPGFHGEAEAGGGSFDTVNSYLGGQYGWGQNTLSLSASGATTDRYLDPPVLQNFTNHGTIDQFAAQYERDLTDKDRIAIILRRAQSKFLVPDEMVQNAAGQRQDRDDFESALELSYEHIFSPNALGEFRAMSRDVTAGFWSNELSTPMIADQDRGYHEAYGKGSLAVHAGINEIKFGGEFDYASIQEALNYLITDPAQFSPDTPMMFAFYGHALDREQSGFAQDDVHWKNLTASIGLRFDHYHLLVDQTAWSPRLGAAYYWPRMKIVFRASYDRVFQTPAFENLLIASSPAVTSLSSQVLRLPVEPARGNYYQAGFARGVFGHVRFNANAYWRHYRNYPDDDLLLNTGISFPIAFATADIYGEEVRLEVPRWGRFSGYTSCSNMRGNGYFPVTGGLFLGDDAAQAASALSGVFPVSQDQRNTVRAKLRYDLTRRWWVAASATYDSGLPIDFTGSYQDAAGIYGPAILDHVNFSDGRTRPLFSLNALLGVTLHQSDKGSLRLQFDAQNLTNRVNVIDFAGLFSGTAIAEPRSANARIEWKF